jgi:hypothetical protein
MKETADKINQIGKLIANSERDLVQAKKLLKKLQEDFNRKKYEDIPGVAGYFDGVKMISVDGKSFDVNPNYAAKSMLVKGDKLKMIEEDGNMIFKQTGKVEREKLEGIVSRKDGEWHVLTSGGSFKVLKEAAVHHNIKVNDKVVIVVPKGVNANYAALEKVVKEEEDEESSKKSDQKDEGVLTLVDKEPEAEKKEEKKEEKKKKPKSKPKPKKPKAKPKKTAKEKDKKEDKPKPEAKTKVKKGSKSSKVGGSKKTSKTKKEEEEKSKPVEVKIVDEDDLR